MPSAEQIAAYIDQVEREAPPLTDEQAFDVAQLLTSPAAAPSATAEDAPEN